MRSDQRPSVLPTIDDVRAAAARIAPYAHRTPVLTSGTLDALAGARLFFKCENLQKVGAFKFRGACNAVMSLAEKEARGGVATHSSGNHAQALALAARLRGVPAHIVMPRTSPQVKRVAVAGYGAAITFCEPTLAARESTLAEVVARTGATFVHPYDDPRVIAGQGTAALELFAQAGPLDAILAPVGGGGLLSGTAIAAAGSSPATRVIGTEPAGADDAFRSLAEGHIVPSVEPRTVCDGLLTSLGELTFAVIRQHVVWERMKIVIEPSSAVPVAALLSRSAGLAGARVGVILSGGNVDLARLPWL
jgi:threonine dehydratase